MIRVFFFLNIQKPVTFNGAMWAEKAIFYVSFYDYYYRDYYYY